MRQGNMGPTGEAQAVCMALSDQQVEDYEAVKAAILNQVGLSTERNTGKNFDTQNRPGDYGPGHLLKNCQTGPLTG